MDVVVTGIGLRSALGCRQTTWNRLLAGESAIQIRQPFTRLAARPLAMTAAMPIDLPSLTDQVVLDALQDAGLSAPLPDCGVVIGSSRGNQASWEQLAAEAIAQSLAPSQKPPGPTGERSSPSPAISPERSPAAWSLADWLDTLPHAAAITAARRIGATGPVLSPMAACATGLWAIAQGFELLQSGLCERVLAGAVEAPITPLTLTGFEQMGALAQTGVYPFDRQREGLVLGEGGAILVLETAAAAHQRQAKIYGRVRGFGLSADGYHVSAPAPASQAAIAAIRNCLHRSHRSPNQIDYIHAHGTATQLNDRNEATLIQQLFPQGVAVSSTKGATGHAIGASGALGAAFCLLALEQQILPPCVGLRQPEFDLDFVRVARPAAVHTTLCFSFGFGGQNAVLAFGQAMG
jgi:3-oxoacyl-[acyl-carrier-protein] synthase II